MTVGPRVTTFRARLTLRWTLAVGTLLAVAFGVVYAGAHVSVHRWLDHNVRTLAATEAASSTDGLNDVHLHEVPFGQLEAEAFTEKFVQIFDARGGLVLQSTRLVGAPPVIPLDVLAQAFAGAAPLITTQVHGRSARVAVLTASREGRLYAVAVGLFSDEVAAGLAQLAWLLVAVWLASVAASAAIASVLAGRALAPVADITARAAWIAQGHFQTRLEPPAVNDEVGRMTTLLNSMLDRLRGAVEANRRFAADASHELRAPLTAMAGELDVTLRHPRSAGEYEETLRHVRGRLSALIGLAEDLMLLVRAQEGGGELVHREVAVGPLVHAAFDRVAAGAAARGVALTRDGLDGVLVYGDGSLIARVIDNVLANAVHYNREGSWVRVTADVVEPDATAWSTPMVTLLVADGGHGIPAAEHERIFERFYRLDQSRARHTGGRGLGLAICREVVALHGGSIRVAASTPAGTTMAITLPGRRADAVAQARTGAPDVRDVRLDEAPWPRRV